MAINLNKSLEYFKPTSVKSRIHIIGCGSVGATLAENLARLGLKSFTLWDFDVVESHNIANQIFRQKDIGKAKVNALVDILEEINPELRESVRVQTDGWNGQQLNGYVFLAVDSIEIRRKIVEMHMANPNVIAMFDFRTLLESAQHYAADWADLKMKTALLNSMQFSHEEAKAETPVSACGITLGVAPTVRAICAVGVANFVNFVNKKALKKLVVFDVFGPSIDAF